MVFTPSMGLRDTRSSKSPPLDHPQDGRFERFDEHGPRGSGRGAALPYEGSALEDREREILAPAIRLVDPHSPAQEEQNTAYIFAQGKALPLAETHDRGTRGDVVDLTFWQLF
jgi:hypothetical protein